MAEYIKLRLTAAKVGVSMALLALIAGVAEKAGARPQVNAKPAAAVDYFLKLDGITGKVANAFVKVELKWIELRSDIASFTHKLDSSYYLKHQLDTQFLKIKAADARYIKFKDAFQYVKYADAFSKFHADAFSKFLKVDGTAANADKLGNLAPSDFVRGRDGGVFTGSLNGLTTTQQQIVGLGGGVFSVLIGLDQPTLQPVLQVSNQTGGPLVAMVDIGGKSVQQTPLPVGITQIPLGSPTGQLQLQTFPSGTFTHVLTLTLSVDSVNGSTNAVAQMVNGDG
jgi:hypothetical protein